MKKNKTYTYIASLLTLSMMFACTSSKLYKGDRNYNNLGYAKSIPYYEKVYEKNEDEAVGLKLAESYYRTGDLANAEILYKRIAVQSETDNTGVISYAKILMESDKHYKAIRVLHDHLEFNKEDKEASRLLRACYQKPERYRDTTLHTLEVLEIDGMNNVFGASPYMDGIVFVADRKVKSKKKQYGWTASSYLDAYSISRSEDGQWEEPVEFSEKINGKYHEGPMAFSKDGNTVYFSRNNYLKKKLEADSTETNHLKIFKASKIEGEWENIEELSFMNDSHSSAHPSLSSDGNTLYFVSDMPGGFGGADIYKVTKVNDQWGTPENLGPTINTSGNELFPFVSESGLLFFSSNAHNSMGGLDVFVAEEQSGTWNEPENLNYPVNSSRDDFGYTVNEKENTGYLSSSRSGVDKVYSFRRHAPTFRLFAFVHEKDNENPLENVKIEITDDQTGQVYPFVTNADGKFRVNLKPEKDYTIFCTKIGCYSATTKVSTKGLKYSEDFEVDFEIDLDILYKSFVLDDIYYDYDKWDLRPESFSELNKLVRILKENPKVHIEMGSHTDARGKDKYNQRLSEKRAHSAVDYLIAAGIDKNRLSFQGYGERVLLNRCKNYVDCSEDEHQLNRRTEFKVMKIDD